MNLKNLNDSNFFEIDVMTMPTEKEIESQIMDLYDEIFTLEDKRNEELSSKYAEWRKVEPLIDKEGVDAVLIHMESMKGINSESLHIYNEVKEIKVRYKLAMDEKRAKIEELKKQK
jgi:hypothetical protein